MADYEVSTVFREPFNEQAAFFRQKLGKLLPSEKWTDVQKAQHDKGFMVAGATTVELLTDLSAAVDRAIVAGDSLDMFRKNFKAIKEKHGWEHTGDFNWRTRVIYQTNLNTSYNAGRLAQLVEGAFLYWVYIHSKTVQNPRRAHLAWDGITLSPDDPWWKSHFTPNGFGCQCRIKGTNRPPANARLQAPASPIDPETGEPQGIGKGWGYMPGDTVKDTVAAMASQTQQWQYKLTKAYMEGLPEGVKDPFSRAYRELPATADAARQYYKRITEGRENFQEYQSLGLVESKTADAIEKTVFTDERKPEKAFQNIDVRGFDFTISADSVGHIRNQHGEPIVKKGKRIGEWQKDQRPVEPEDFEMIPKILNDPDSVQMGRLTDKRRMPAVTYTKMIDGEKFVLTMEIFTGKKSINVHALHIKRKP